MMLLNEKIECMWFWIFKTCKTQVDGFDLGFDHWISPSNNMHVVFFGEILPPSSSNSTSMNMHVNNLKKKCLWRGKMEENL